ncbi:MAG: hypothetical protein GEU95_17365 [Rhizobiales bacterium]|nr:hypothetical protein [Hyphomicrobiales bacterium]
MIPDLRFVIGAVIATALLGVTVFGLAAAMHLSYQSKLGPLEASRLLAYSSDGRSRIPVPAPRLDNPFANIPVDPSPLLMRPPAMSADQSPAPLQQQAEPIEPPAQTAATNAQPADDREPASFPPPDDLDTVDERAVIDPPLPLDDASAPSTESAPAAESGAPGVPTPEPAVADTTPPVESPAAPVETTPVTPAPVVESPPEPSAAPEVEQVGTIAVTTNPAETRDDAPAVVDVPAIAKKPEPVKAKRKRAVRKPVARRRRPARRATAPINPLFPSIGYPMNAPSNANRPAKGFWRLD